MKQVFHLGLVSALALSAYTLSGCTLGPDFKAPQAAVPAQWTEPANGLDLSAPQAEALRQWWQSFHDPVLDGLVQKALAGNFDVRIATQRVLAAQATLVSTSAALLPSLSLDASASRNKPSDKARFPPPHFVGPYNNFQPQLEVSWELDLFGKTRRAIEAGRAAIDVQVEDRHAAILSLLGEVATDYANLRSAQLRQSIAQRNIGVEQEALNLTQSKYKGGLGSDLDVAQASQQLAALKAEVPQLQTVEAQNIHAIALLLGVEAGAIEADLKRPGILPPTPPVLPATLPSAVVHNRPDIRAAERQFAQTNALIGVAVAQQYPDFTISPSYGIQAGSISHLLNSGAVTWALTAGVAQPIFDAGKLEAGVIEARANAEADRLSYEKTVLTAFQEVEDAIIALNNERQRHIFLQQSADASRIAVERSTQAYRSGFGDFLSVLDSERTLYSAEDSLAQSDLVLVGQTIALYKALGGGWQVDTPSHS